MDRAAIKNGAAPSEPPRDIDKMPWRFAGLAAARVAALEAVGPIAEDMPNYEDYDWFLRVRECGVTMVSHDRVSLHRRMHHGSTSQRRPASQAELLGALQRSLRRRRGSGSMLALPRLSDLGDRGAS